MNLVADIFSGLMGLVTKTLNLSIPIGDIQISFWELLLVGVVISQAGRLWYGIMGGKSDD